MQQDKLKKELTIILALTFVFMIVLTVVLRTNFTAGLILIHFYTALITFTIILILRENTELFDTVKRLELDNEFSAYRSKELYKFQLAVEGASDLIAITDLEGKILYINSAATDITGYSRYELIGQKAGKAWGGNMKRDTYKRLWKTIKEKKHVFKDELDNKRKNGEKYIAEVTISPILDEQGAVMFFVGIERDITKAKEVEKMKNEFISLASHQLRTPLTAMKWLIELLLDGEGGKLKKEHRDMIDSINQSNERMIKLVNSLLNVSRIESGRIIVEPMSTDIKELVKGVISEVEVKAREKEQKIVFSCHPNLPKLNIDPKLVRNVYQNLLTNSIRYSPVGSDITLIISKDSKNLISQVSDNGFGIPSNVKDKIFQKFYRAPNAVKVETKGTGLGLYLAKQIVEASEGKMWFISEEDKGTSFWFTLPLKGMEPKEGEVELE
jgi:PAS domain S-box-containing protein